MEDPYGEQAERFSNRIERTRESRLLVIEIGAGPNTLGVIRWPMERIVYAHRNAHLVRVNLQWPQVPQEIAHKRIPLGCRARHAITGMREALGMDDARVSDSVASGPKS